MPVRSIVCFATLPCAALFAGHASTALAAAPVLTKVRPLEIAPGVPSRLSVAGDNLTGPRALWTSFTAETKLDDTNRPATFSVSIPKTVGAGVGAIRWIGTNGISNPYLVLVDPLNAVTVASFGTNHSPLTAQRVTSPGAVDGVCEEVRSDYYRFTGKRGQRVTVEVVAQRLASPLDPYLRILDADRKELAETDDTPGLGSDARLDFRCPRAGDYWIEVRDTRYAGGPRHRYRLRLGPPLPVPLPFLLRPELAADRSGLAELTRVAEREPNDGPRRVQSISWPALIAGSFGKNADRDVYEFPVAKGDVLVLTGGTRSRGWPSDLFLQLQRTNGATIAEANAGGADDGALTNRFSENGLCRLVVEELNGRSGDSLRYELRLEKSRPGFTLATDVERISLVPGDAVEVEVRAERRDFAGPLALEVRGLGPGFTTTDAVIAAGTNSTKLKIFAPATVAIGSQFDLTILGQAEVDGTNLVVRASTMTALRAVFPELRYAPRELDGLLTLSIAGSTSSTPLPSGKKKKK